jgi:hypothetical protein
VSLVATLDLIALDMSLTARSCHKSVIIKHINEKEKNKEKKPTRRKKLMKKKEKI